MTNIELYRLYENTFDDSKTSQTKFQELTPAKKYFVDMRIIKGYANKYCLQNAIEKTLQDEINLSIPQIKRRLQYITKLIEHTDNTKPAKLFEKYRTMNISLDDMYHAVKAWYFEYNYSHNKHTISNKLDYTSNAQVVQDKENISQIKNNNDWRVLIQHGNETIFSIKIQD